MPAILGRILMRMPEAIRPALELGLWAATLAIAGCLTLLQPGYMLLDWPPSPAPARAAARREFVLTFGAATLIVMATVAGGVALAGASMVWMR